MQNDNKFKDPKIGDAICIPSTRWSGPTKRTIVKVTPTRITDDCGITYRREDGREVGSNGSRTRERVIPWTDEHTAEVNANRIVNELARAAEHLARNISVPRGKLTAAAELTAAIYAFCPRKDAPAIAVTPAAC